MSIFPPHTKSDWLAKVAKATKGTALDLDGVLFQRIEGGRALRSGDGPWTIFARIDHPSIVKSRKQAEDDIDNGVGGLVLTSTGPVEAIAALPLHKLAVRNEADDSGAAALCKLIARQPLDPARMAVDFGVGDAALAKAIAGQGFTSPLKRGDGRSFHNAGCDDATELGAALAQAVAGLRSVEFLSDARLARAVSITLAASQDMFSTLAKFRAARLLWSGVLSACKLPDAALSLHGETSMAMMSNVDAHTNILRAVAAVFGAGLGGADSIAVLPFSAAQGLPNAFARRVASNVQNVLLHESHLWRVADPAGGAGASERLTERMCEQAWGTMQACERGDWPTGGDSKIRPVIGVTTYKPQMELPHEIEEA